MDEVEQNSDCADSRGRESVADPGRAVSAFGALRESNFRRFFVGQTTSVIGGAMSPLATTFAVLAHGSTSDLGYVLAAGTAPLVIFLLVGGVVADRVGRRRVMLGADGIRFVGQSLLAAWVLAGTVPLWGFLTLAGISGIGTGLFSPALTGLVSEVVSDRRLQQANALGGLAASGASILGPALAGVIVSSSSPGWAIAADALSFLVSLVCLSRLRLARRPSRESSSFVRELREGWGEFWARTWLWVIVIQFSLCNVVFTAPFYVLGAEIAKQLFGGARAWGIVLACQGAGAIVGGLVMLKYRPSRPLAVAIATTYAWALPLFGLAFRLPLELIAAGSLLGGVAFAVFGTIWDTTLQRNVPSEVLSRVSAYDWFGSLVLLPVGESAIGPLARVAGTRDTLLGAASLLVLAVTVVLFVPAVTSLRSPTGSDAAR
jgi:MFS family permease